MYFASSRMVWHWAASFYHISTRKGQALLRPRDQVSNGRCGKTHCSLASTDQSGFLA